MKKGYDFEKEQEAYMRGYGERKGGIITSKITNMYT